LNLERENVSIAGTGWRVWSVPIGRSSAAAAMPLIKEGRRAGRAAAASEAAYHRLPMPMYSLPEIATVTHAEPAADAQGHFGPR
jgi:hypothetical protein